MKKGFFILLTFSIFFVFLAGCTEIPKNNLDTSENIQKDSLPSTFTPTPTRTYAPIKYQTQSPVTSPKLEKYVIYAPKPTNSKNGYLVWDYDPYTDEYLAECTSYSDYAEGFMGGRDNAIWWSRDNLESRCNVKIGEIDPNSEYTIGSVSYVRGV